MYIVTNVFGQRYRLLTPAEGISPSGVSAEKFSDLVSAERFLKNMDVCCHYWPRLLVHEFNGSVTATDQEAISILAPMILHAKLNFFELESDSSATSSASGISVKGRNGESYQFVTAKAALVLDSRNIEPIADAKAAKVYLEKLAVDEEALADLVKASASPSARNTRDSVTQALASGKFLILKAKKPLPKAKGFAEESVQSVPGNKKVDSPPSEEKVTQNVVAFVDTDGAQAEALKSAAEDGSPFCEECAEDEKQKTA